MTSSNSSEVYLPWILILPKPVVSAVGRLVIPLVRTSTVFCESVTARILAPAITAPVIALENVCNEVSELIPTFIVIDVAVTPVIVIGLLKYGSRCNALGTPALRG